MKYRSNIIYSAALILMAVGSGCSDDKEGLQGLTTDYGVSQTLNLTPMNMLNKGGHDINSHAGDCQYSSIMADYRTIREIGKEITGVDLIFYPRIKKMANGEYIMFYQDKQVSSTTYYSIGTDLDNWGQGNKLYVARPITNALGNRDTRGYCTCDAVVLPDGDILTAASYRATSGYGKTPVNNGIAVRRSSDNGRTWSEEIEVYQGTNYEPYILLRKSGRIEIYFSQSRPQISSNHSGTAMVWSDDNGRTWKPDFGSEPYTVIRTRRGEKDGQPLWTDQMPSVLELNGSTNLAAATEAYLDETYNISMAYAEENFTKIEGNDVGPSQRNIKMWAGAAPYLKQFVSGETLLSYNAAQSRFYVTLGNSEARDFGDAKILFPNSAGYWGATDIESEHSFIGIYRSAGQIILGRFFLNHAIMASSHIVNVDADNSEWPDKDEALFVGEKGRAQATLRCSADQDNVYFLVEVHDEDISKDDYVNILLSPMTATGKINSEARRIKIAANGLRSTDQYAGGWRELPMNVVAKGAYDGTIGDRADVDHGYLVEVSVAKSDLVIKDGKILVNLVLFDSAAGEDAISPTTDRNLGKWIPIKGL